MKQVMVKLDDEQSTSLKLACSVTGMKQGVFIIEAITAHVANVRASDEFKAAVKAQQATLASLLK